MAGRASNPFYIEPAVTDISPVLKGFGSLVQESRAEALKKANADKLMSAFNSGDPNQIAELIASNPELKDQINSMMGYKNGTTQKSFEKAMRGVLSTNDPEMQREILATRINEVTDAGGDATDSLQLMRQLNEDPEGFKRSMGTLASTFFSKQEMGEFNRQRGIGGEIDGISEVQSSKILPGGLVQLVRKSGTVEVVPAAEADAELVKQAENRGAKLQGIRAQERESGKGASKVALGAFDKVGKIRSNIDNLQEGIRLVREEGAQTGPIAQKLPSFRAGTIKLNQLQKRLGLDIIGAVTFGALSKGELDLAKDVALPKGLNEDEIVDWMEKRIVAQQKLANNLEEAAVFLSTAGNTVADFIKFNKEREQVSKEAKKQAVNSDDSQAIAWAKANPSDPRAAQILQAQGAQ